MGFNTECIHFIFRRCGYPSDCLEHQGKRLGTTIVRYIIYDTSV